MVELATVGKVPSAGGSDSIVCPQHGITSEKNTSDNDKAVSPAAPAVVPLPLNIILAVDGTRLPLPSTIIFAEKSESTVYVQVSVGSVCRRWRKAATRQRDVPVATPYCLK